MSQHRRFIRFFLIMVSVVLVCIVTLNVLVDPYDLVGVRLLPALVRSDRRVKTELLANTITAPDILIMGSSRTLKLSPETIRHLTGQSALNLGTGSCRAEGPLLMSLYAESVDRLPKTIIVGVDLEGFHDKLPADQRWNRVPGIRGRIKELDESGYKLFFNNFSELLSLDMAKDSIRSLRREFDESPPIPRTRFRDDGVIEYPLWESWKTGGTFSLDTQINLSVREYRGRYRGFGELAEWRKTRFEEFLQFCLEHDIHVIAFTTTLHPRVRDDLREQVAFDQLQSDLLAFLEEMAAEYDMVYYDFSDTASYGGNDAHFWDGAHIDSTNADKLLLHLLTPGRRDDE